jgi:hypothetical protein
MTASVACRKTAGVPVLHKVAARRLPTCPDLPIPVTTTFPGCRRITSTARCSSSATRLAAARITCDSASMTVRAQSTSDDSASESASDHEVKPAWATTAEATSVSTSGSDSSVKINSCRFVENSRALCAAWRDSHCSTEIPDAGSRSHSKRSADTDRLRATTSVSA